MSIYIISDYHFDDGWINENLRNFADVNAMNETMLERASNTVGQDDKFVFFGDIVGKDRDEKQAWEWQGKLPEIDTWIVGNHDPFEASNYDDSHLPLQRGCELTKGKYSFIGRHRPGNLPEFKSDIEWGIYGHKHTNHKKNYPFLDQESQRINVSAGLVHYRPISLSEIIDLIETGNSYGVRP
ncbi:hypothetical protein PM032_17925 [Halorubrum ezzemoulense]|uniref:hypothetical protein n=1 Tax=Halorubrum ezzemoulense TaxID=337243 RepID=UPI00232F19B4|nr:hypothetical protein [Halorubrum ezzemoulense]MDB2272845.1 hypothetical protein [Halorubrum ezzemoulense]